MQEDTTVTLHEQGHFISLLWQQTVHSLSVTIMLKHELTKATYLPRILCTVHKTFIPRWVDCCCVLSSSLSEKQKTFNCIMNASKQLSTKCLLLHHYIGFQEVLNKILKKISAAFIWITNVYAPNAYLTCWWHPLCVIWQCYESEMYTLWCFLELKNNIQIKFLLMVLNSPQLRLLKSKSKLLFFSAFMRLLYWSS